MKAYVTRDFSRQARREGVKDRDLCEVIERAERGLIDARIGRFLIKQRVARPNQGRSGGFRTIIFYRRGDRAVFLHMFAKSGKANLSAAEEEAYREFAGSLASLSPEHIGALVAQRRWIELDYEGYQRRLS